MEELNQTLSDLGLTVMQTKVILALSKFEYAAVVDIAKAAGTHRQEIYPVLKELQKIGLVERRIGIPNMYNTIPIDQTLKILLERKANWMSELQKKTTKLIENRNSELKSRIGAKQEEYDFTLITGIERFGRALADWTNKAQTVDTVLILDPFSYQIRERLLPPDFRFRDNARVRIVTCAHPKDVDLSGLEKIKLELRFSPFDMPVDIAIYNGNRAHLAIFSNRDVMHTEVAALTSNHPSYVKMLQNYFDVLWNSAKIGKQKREAKKTKPRKHTPSQLSQ